jgi:hypothetical protein
MRPSHNPTKLRKLIARTFLQTRGGREVFDAVIESAFGTGDHPENPGWIRS